MAVQLQPPDARARAAAAIRALQRWYEPKTGLWHGTGWWNTDNRYKNAITSELFVTLAALLHQRTPGDTGYRTWALRAWDWFGSSGLIGAGDLVNDGLTSSCQNNGGTTWTYNQGVILGGLGALFEITGDRGYLEHGESIANAVL